jgi:hypothetical protein
MAGSGEGGRRAIGLNGVMTDSFAIVLAGGGERLVAWQAGVLAGLAEGGLDPRRARTAVGTSAGALVAERLTAGTDPDPGPPRASRVHSNAAATFARLAGVWAEHGSERDLASMRPDPMSAAGAVEAAAAGRATGLVFAGARAAA